MANAMAELDGLDDKMVSEDQYSTIEALKAVIVEKFDWPTNRDFLTLRNGSMAQEKVLGGTTAH